MPWDSGLTEEQRSAAGHLGAHARLLAGPGTGKTLVLTRRICFLVEQEGVEPEAILSLTFTRAAARELRQRVQAELGTNPLPRISTLHSFALRQLLRNSALVTHLPQPLRIADDWEERHIIVEDLKTLLSLTHVDQVRDLISSLSADWQTLTADDERWQDRFPDPAFLGAWRAHREVYGYVLRAELVYQMKRSLEQYGHFDLEGPSGHLLVDEYQDLNRCDLAVIKAIAARGFALFVAGDDDQSIYGFRKAHPAEIRRFLDDYPGASDLALELCKRCDAKILELGLFVARQDYDRIGRPVRPEDGRVGGLVLIRRFSDQQAEADGISAVCAYLLGKRKIPPEEILILVRSDRNQSFSSVIRRALEGKGIAVTTNTPDSNPFNSAGGRLVLATLRLIVNSEDHLAWRSLLELRRNNLGPVALGSLYRLARARAIRFAQALFAVAATPSLLPEPHGSRVQSEVTAIKTLLEQVPVAPSALGSQAKSTMMDILQAVVEASGVAGNERDRLIQQFEKVAAGAAVTSTAGLLRAIETWDERIEQERQSGTVNILTMHQAKGLTSEAVIIAAAEDEYLPGRASGEAEGDERRLLYVSLTRARRFLLVTYCDRRFGAQQHTGRTAGKQARSLTRFLRDGPIAPMSQ